MKIAPIEVRPSAWGSADGTQTPIVRLSAGKGTLAVEYEDLPRLIAELAQLLEKRLREGTSQNDK